MNKKISVILSFILLFCILIQPTIISKATEQPKYKIDLVYDSSLCDVLIEDTYTNETIENGGYIYHNESAGRAYLSIHITNIKNNYRIAKVTSNGKDRTEGIVSGAYGGMAMTISQDTVFEILLEEIPQILPQVLSGSLYTDPYYTQPMGNSINFESGTRIYTEANISENVPEYHSGCYYEYSVDNQTWIPCTEWGNRTDFWAGWSYHDFDFVNTKNYYMRVHLFGRDKYTAGDWYSEPFIVNPEMKISEGDYIQMGKYYNEPILWRCVFSDENGLMILSDKQLSMKCYSGGTNQKKAWDGEVTYDEVTWGDNNWSISDIRSWLNSTKKSGEVVWIDGSVPDDNANFRGYNSYENEAGFLSKDNFTQNELMLIKDVQRKIYLDKKDASQAEGGTKLDAYTDETIESINVNLEDSYYHIVADKVFLPGLSDLKKIYNNSDILGEGYYYAYPTEQAKSNTEMSYRDGWDIWVNHPATFTDSDGSSVYTLSSSGDFGWRASCGSDLTGIRPAFYLSDNTKIESGSGTAQDPYILSSTLPYTKTIVDTVNNTNIFTVSPLNIQPTTSVILALYKNGLLTDIQCQQFDGNSCVFNSTKEYDKAKVMVWDTSLSLRPLCISEEL